MIGTNKQIRSKQEIKADSVYVSPDEMPGMIHLFVVDLMYHP